MSCGVCGLIMAVAYLCVLLSAALALELSLPLTDSSLWSLAGSSAADSQSVTLTTKDTNEAGVLVSTTSTTATSWHLDIHADVTATPSEEQVGFSVWFSADKADTSSSGPFGVPSKLTGSAVLFDLRSNSVQAAQYKDGSLVPAEDPPVCLFRAIGSVDLRFTAVLGQVTLTLKSKQIAELSCLTVSTR